MVRSRSAAFVVAVGACVGLVSGAGAAIRSDAAASTAQVDLSTRAGVVHYLATLGFDPSGFVIQRGRHNYAGPKCPGKGWSCTRSTRVVQIATQAGNNAINNATQPRPPARA